MATRPHNLLDAWHTWSAHHRQILRDNPQEFAGKVAIRMFRRRIRNDWKKLSKLHPNDHGVRKLRFHRRVKRLQRVTSASRRASARKHAHSAQSRVNHAVDNPEPHEDFLKALTQVLRDLKRLIRFERRVLGEPAERIRGYDQAKKFDLKRRIQENARRLARARLRYEGIVPPNQIPPNRQPSRSRYQQLGQPHRNVDHRPGGKMFYVHLETSQQTTAACWVLTDRNNVIVDRVVAKDVWDIQEFHRWTNPLYWFGDPTDPTMKQPHEALIQEKLEHESILRIDSWHLHANKLMCRFLLEYCPYGDAMELANKYRVRWILRGRNAADMIPEPAIWHIFETLIKAGLVMERGDVDHPKAGWADVGGPVVHLDLKPENLFIGAYPDQSGEDGEDGEDSDDPDNFAVYPAFKVSDFGLAIDDRCRHPPGDDSYRGRGTPDNLSPEQLLDFSGQNQDPLNTKTNVWVAGIILMTLMSLNSMAGSLTFEEAATNERDPNLVPRFKQRAVEKYTNKLRTMILRCVQFRQRDRPTFGDLLTELRIATNIQPGLHARDYAQGARHATLNNLPGTLRPLDFLGPERYAIGFTGLNVAQGVDSDSD